MIEAPDLTRSPGVLFGAGGVDVAGTAERVREVPRPITASDVVIGTRRRLPRNQLIPAVGSPDGCPALSLTSGTGPSRVTEAGMRRPAECPGRGGAKLYRPDAFLELGRNELEGGGCSRWSCTEGFATPARSRG